jgi:hypothetical protein
MTVERMSGMIEKLAIILGSVAGTRINPRHDVSGAELSR